MLDDFFVRAILAGVGLALVAGPLGCFIVWRRMAYFGDTLAHSSLLGVALALFMDVSLLGAVFFVAALVSVILVLLERRAQLSSDALLGILSHSALALGLVVLSLMTWLRIDLTGLLFGDILAVSQQDLLIIWVGGAFIFAFLRWLWRPLLAVTVNEEMALAEGIRAKTTGLAFMLVMAAFIAIAMKIVGVILITAMLIIPAAAARRLSSNPEQMAAIAAAIGCLCVIAGLFGSLQFDTPSGPSIVVVALIVFVACQVPLQRTMR